MNNTKKILFFISICCSFLSYGFTEQYIAQQYALNKLPQLARLYQKNAPHRDSIDAWVTKFHNTESEQWNTLKTGGTIATPVPENKKVSPDLQNEIERLQKELAAAQKELDTLRARNHPSATEPEKTTPPTPPAPPAPAIEQQEKGTKKTVTPQPSPAAPTGQNQGLLEQIHKGKALKPAAKITPTAPAPTLQEQIKKGSELKPVSERPTTPKPEAEKPDLLGDIKKGKSLKKASERQLGEKPKAPLNTEEQQAETFKKKIEEKMALIQAAVDDKKAQADSESDWD